MNLSNHWSALSLFDDCFLIGKKNYYTFLITQDPIIVDSNKTRQQLHNLEERDTEKVRKKNNLTKTCFERREKF